MADIWSGAILLPDNTAVTDISLASPNASSRPVPATALRFLSTVATAHIPLYLAAGPTLDVWTTNEATQNWFQAILLSTAGPAVAEDASTPDWWACARAQSPIGILAQVEAHDASVDWPRITEILFYGTIASTTTGALPTPPSSSPDSPHNIPESLPELRVHALPLSSDLFHRSTVPDDCPANPAHNASGAPVDHEPGFLSSALGPGLPTTGSSPKRKRDIFDEAAEARKKARRKGGAGVAAAAAAAAKGQDSQRRVGHGNSISIDPKTTALSDARPPFAHSVLSRPPSRQLSRSPSLASEPRPMSRKGLHEPQARRSTLSRVATITLQPEEPTTETRNKEALSKVVMAAMRLHGLQQRKKSKSRLGSVAPGVQANDAFSEETAADEAAKDEEYKIIYHQTFKGAVLAFRMHISTKPLYSQPDRLRHIVEQLLSIFCADPLTQPLPSEEPLDLLATPGNQLTPGLLGSSHGQVNPFDLPSANRYAAVKATDDTQLGNGSPVSRRREQTATMMGILG
ncbi:hypothetical protein BDV95DRAFT_478516 [Massariosphaeria phaeospora]|uniref:Sld7 C-terminal domain-containing protein n=1 Tax=Massariosphaeria phaeospora TaxID=100035 RepID=A0A7C8IG64_9PLEO|nr:hypothetical protein BDV95DRAFT_478516 [Massariosphaeria phaeospora]